MTKRGGRAKTRKSVAKRFKMTASGGFKRNKQSRRHLMRKKNSKRKRSLAAPAMVHVTNAPSVRQNMPWG